MKDEALTAKQLLDLQIFCIDNRVDVLMGADCQYMAYVNYIKGHGGDGVSLCSPLYAMYMAMINYNKTTQDGTDTAT